MGLLSLAFLGLVTTLAPVASAYPAAQLPKPAPTAELKNGTYKGIHSEKYNQDFFLGIPFAQPPVDNLRFRVPQSLNSTWKGEKDATSYSAACFGYGPDTVAYPEHSEDCLYLNIIRPSGYEDQELPIGLYIHGGGYFDGSGVDQRYNTSYIVEQSVKIGQPIIGVTINYRVSTWGFLGSEEIVESGQTNLGLRDQRLALHWIQENIAAFGGDPSKVTIWGESAGASSVGFHITAYGGRDDKLFRGGIMQSGNPIFFQSMHFNQSVFDFYVSKTGCDGSSDKLQCMREIPSNELHEIFNGTAEVAMTLRPYIDGDFLTGYISEQLEKEEFVHVPIISGANSDEGSGFSPSPIDSSEDFEEAITSNPVGTSREFAQEVLKAYPDIPSQGIPGSPPLPEDYRPGPSQGSHHRRSAAYYGDAYFIANRRLTCKTWASAGLDAYCYRFNAIPNGQPDFIGVTHFSEVAYVFRNLDATGYETNPFEGMPQSHRDLSTLMSRQWASFISTGGDPNAHLVDPNQQVRNQLQWPKYACDGEIPKDLVFDANVTHLGYAEDDTYRQEGIDLINAHNVDVFER